MTVQDIIIIFISYYIVVSILLLSSNIFLYLLCANDKQKYLGKMENQTTNSLLFPVAKESEVANSLYGVHRALNFTNSKTILK